MVYIRTTAVLLIVIVYLISSHAECHLTIGRSIKKPESGPVKFVRPLRLQYKNIQERPVYPDLYPEDFSSMERRTRKDTPFH